MDEEFYDVESDERQEMKRLEAMLVAAASKPEPEPKPELSMEAKGNLLWLQTTFKSKFTPPITQKDMFYLMEKHGYGTVDLRLLREEQREIDEEIANRGKISQDDLKVIFEIKEDIEDELKKIESLIKTGRNRKGGNQSKRKTSKRKTHKKRKVSKRKTSKRKTHKRRKASKRKVSKRKTSKRK